MAEELMLDAKLDLSAAAALHAQLLKACNDDVVLDARNVTHMGALCVQILIAAARKAGEGGHGFEMRNFTDRVVGQLAAMGMSPETISGGAR